MNKIRSGIAEMLALDKIQSKLDNLARKDLLSSRCFLQEAINILITKEKALL